MVVVEVNKGSMGIRGSVFVSGNRCWMERAQFFGLDIILGNLLLIII